jgi:hypothetical protein
MSIAPHVVRGDGCLHQQSRDRRGIHADACVQQQASRPRMDEAATHVCAAWRGAQNRRWYAGVVATRTASKICIRSALHRRQSRRSRDARNAAAVRLQAAARRQNVRRCMATVFFTGEPLRTCGQAARWKVGVGDLTKQLSTLYNIGRACGLQYVHSPLSSSHERLAKRHRGSTRLDDIDVDGSLGVGLCERHVRSLPPLRSERITFDDDTLDCAAAALRTARAPCLLILCFRYELLNCPATIARLARLLRVPPPALLATKTFRLHTKYRLARQRDGFSCGWHASPPLEPRPTSCERSANSLPAPSSPPPPPFRIAVHVRRGDRAYVEDSATLYMMHRGLWTGVRPRDGMLALAAPPCANTRARDANVVRGRAPPAHLFVAAVALIRERLDSGPAAQAQAQAQVLVVSDGYDGEDYYDGFGERVDALFSAKRADDWHVLSTIPHSTLIVGNAEEATRTAIDALATADILITGSGSHLPDVCQRYLRVRPAVRFNVWEERDALQRSELPVSTLSHLDALLKRRAARAQQRSPVAEAHGEAPRGGVPLAPSYEDVSVDGEQPISPTPPLRTPGGCAARGSASSHSPSSSLVDVCGRSMAVRRLLADPRMAHLDGFLTSDECEHIIRLGEGSLHES